MPANSAAPIQVNARGMKCPWPVLRVARAMRSAVAVTVEADDPMAPGELAALAQQQGWTFGELGGDRFTLARVDTA